MTLGLAAPAAVAVEVRTADRRVFRLSHEIGLGGVRLRAAGAVRAGTTGDGALRPAGFEGGGWSWTPRWSPPAIPARRRDSGVDARSTSASRRSEARAAITAYVADRLGLPPLP